MLSDRVGLKTIFLDSPDLAPPSLKFMPPWACAVCWMCFGTTILTWQDGCNDFFTPLSPGLGAPGLSIGSASPQLSPKAQEWERNETGVPLMTALRQCDRQEGLPCPTLASLSHQAGLHLLVGTWEG